jgi:ribosome biogenesis GTPase A
MALGWYPGHMVKARRDAAETLAKVDLVIEVIDARLPGASANPMIESLRLHRQRPALKVLNKADIADPAATAAWIAALDRVPGVKAVAISSRKPADVAKLPKLAAALVPHRDSTLKPVRALVMGIPNVGKSTLVNALLKRKAAKVGDEPGVTKHQNRYQVTDRFELVDMPGLMWPAIERHTDALMLAASHAMGVNAYIDEEVATFLAEVLKARYPQALRDRYGFDPAVLDGPAMIAAIAKRRGFVLKGGVADLEKAAVTLLNDYRSGALGRISLETPESRAALLAAHPDPAPATDALPGDDAAG